MTLIGQDARSGDYASENSREGVKNGNVDKIRAALKFQVSNISFRFSKNEQHGALPNQICERYIYLYSSFSVAQL